MQVRVGVGVGVALEACGPLAATTEEAGGGVGVVLCPRIIPLQCSRGVDYFGAQTVPRGTGHLRMYNLQIDDRQMYHLQIDRLHHLDNLDNLHHLDPTFTVMTFCARAVSHIFLPGEKCAQEVMPHRDPIQQTTLQVVQMVI